MNLRDRAVRINPMEEDIVIPPMPGRQGVQGRGGRGRGGRGRGRGRNPAGAQNPAQAQNVAQENIEVPPPPPQADIAAMLAAMQQRLNDLEAENIRLRNAQRNPPVIPEVVPPVVEAAAVPVVVPIVVPPLAQGPQEQRTGMFKRFQSMKPTEFEGLVDPLLADNWIKKLVSIFDVQEIPDYGQVRCAAFMLINDAQNWWESVKTRRNVAEMTWNQFEVEFRKKYFNTQVLKTRQEEFGALKQGSMTVDELVVKFNQFSRLCPRMVPNEEEKVRRFIETLRPEIARGVDGPNQSPTTMNECVDWALNAEYWEKKVGDEKNKFLKSQKDEKVLKQLEESQKKTLTSGTQQGNSGNRGNQGSSRNNNNHNGNGKRPFNGNNGPSNDERNVQPRNGGMQPCPNCNKMHFGECRAHITCFNCRKQGHYANSCTAPKQLQAYAPRPPAPKLNAVQTHPMTLQYESQDQQQQTPKTQVYAYTNANNLPSTSGNKRE